MSERTSTIHLSIPKGSVAKSVLQRVPIWLAAVMALILAAIVICTALLVAGPAVERMTAGTPSITTHAAFLAANPEVRVLTRYAATAQESAHATFLVRNPEVRLFQRHAASMSEGQAASFLDQNPELRVLLRYQGQTGD